MLNLSFTAPLRGLAILALVAASSLPAVAQTLRVGTAPGVLADTIEVAADVARAQGMDVEVTVFTDWTTPNIALDSGDIDVNYFQHEPFLANAVAQKGYDFAIVGEGVLPNVGLYSKKYSSLAEIPDGAQVGLANDPVNQGRGLRLLAAAGLITLPADAPIAITIDDIAENPKNLRFVELEGLQLVRALDDLDLAQGFPAQFVNAGQGDFAGQALLFSPFEEAFAIRFVTRSDGAANPLVARFVDIYQNAEEVRAQIKKSYAGNEDLYSLAWLK